MAARYAIAAIFCLSALADTPAHADTPSINAEPASSPSGSAATVPTPDPIARATEVIAPPPLVTHVQLAPEVSVQVNPYLPFYLMNTFPQPVQIGVASRCEGSLFLCNSRFRYYLDGGYFKLGVGSGASKDLSEYSFEMGTRYFPFSFPLYLSAGLGYRHIGFSADMSAFQLDNQSIATTANLDLATFYFTPAIGFNVGITRRLYFGMDLGVQLPIISAGSLWLVNSNTGQSSDNTAELQTETGTAMNRVAGLIIPTLTLLRLTYNLD